MSRQRPTAWCRARRRREMPFPIRLTASVRRRIDSQHDRDDEFGDQVATDAVAEGVRLRQKMEVIRLTWSRPACSAGTGEPRPLRPRMAIAMDEAGYQRGGAPVRRAGLRYDEGLAGRGLLKVPGRRHIDYSTADPGAPARELPIRMGTRRRIPAIRLTSRRGPTGLEFDEDAGGGAGWRNRPAVRLFEAMGTRDRRQVEESATQTPSRTAHPQQMAGCASARLYYLRIYRHSPVAHTLAGD